MKKILLATTMLAGTAGFAAAEVTVSGAAEMGIYSDTLGDVQFWQDVEVFFTMSGTTDGGLEFGTKVDLDEADDQTGTGGTATDDWGVAVYISGTFGKLTMGDTDGALDWAIQDSGSLTSLADDHTSHVAYFSADGLDGTGDGQILRYDNTFGAFGVAVSLEQGDDGVGVADDIYALGLKYSPELGGTTLNIGLAYQDAGTAGSVMGVSLGADLAGGFSGTIGYLSYDDHPLDNHIGVGLTYTSGPVAVHANYGQLESAAGVSTDSYGVAVNYDLGGGAAVQFGYGSDMNGAGDDTWSLGIGMSF